MAFVCHLRRSALTAVVPRLVRTMAVGEPPAHIVEDAIAVIMPQLSPSMKFGSIERWVKQEGDAVEVGDVLFEIRTEGLLADDGTGDDPGSWVMTVESHECGILAMAMPVESEMSVGTCVGMIVESEEEHREIVEASLGGSCCNGVALPEVWTGRSLLDDDGVRTMMWQAYLLEHDAPVDIKEHAPVGP